MTTERIDHATRALQLSQSEYSDPRTDTAVAIQTEALVHATLALVEQQRISNLIALANGETYLARIAYGELAGGFGPEGAGVLPEIADALGIGAQKEEAR